MLATVRVGDHAHVDVYTGGRKRPGPDPVGDVTHRMSLGGHAGRLVIAWPDWVSMRDRLAGGDHPEYLIREVENPTQAQLETHVG